MKNITHQHRLGYEDGGYLDVIGQHMGHQLQEWANGDVNPGRNLPLTSVDKRRPSHGGADRETRNSFTSLRTSRACAHAHRHKHVEKYVHHCTSEKLCKFDQNCTLSHFYPYFEVVKSVEIPIWRRQLVRSAPCKRSSLGPGRATFSRRSRMSTLRHALKSCKTASFWMKTLGFSSRF